MMVRGIVQDEDCLAPPIRILCCEFGNKLWNENAKDFMINVCLDNREVQLTKVVDCCKHRKSRCDIFWAHSILLTTSPPFHTSKVHLTDPSLIDVDEPLALLHLRKKNLSTSLTFHQRSFGVCLARHSLHTLISHTQCITKDISHVGTRNFKAVLLLQDINDLRSLPQIMLSLQKVLSSSDGKVQLLCSNLLFLGKSLYKLRVSLISLKETVHQHGSDVELDCHFLMRKMFLN